MQLTTLYVRIICIQFTFHSKMLISVIRLRISSSTRVVTPDTHDSDFPKTEAPRAWPISTCNKTFKVVFNPVSYNVSFSVSFSELKKKNRTVLLSCHVPHLSYVNYHFLTPFPYLLPSSANHNVYFYLQLLTLVIVYRCNYNHNSLILPKFKALVYVSMHWQ